MIIQLNVCRKNIVLIYKKNLEFQMVTPLYKALKENGTTFYAFPGAAEDISAAYQNSNYKMYFSKYILLNFPAQNLSNPAGTQSENIYWNFDTFNSLTVVQPEAFADKVVESLRNYVANHEVTIRESRLNNTEYYYDHTALETTTEKIFFKWCKNLGLIDFDVAIAQDEFEDGLPEFEAASVDESFFKEFLWKERSTEVFGIVQFESDGTYITLTINGISNFREGDVIIIDGVDNLAVSQVFWPSEWQGSIKLSVTDVSIDGNDNHVITTDYLDASLNTETADLSNATARLDYHRLVQYIGEINGVSNVQEANKAYTEVFAHVPDHTGQTPDILFRTKFDVNYKPGLIFPIIPNQYQPEIIGAELFSSPIVSNPQNYPGGYYGDFDTEDFTYLTENGDSVRRSGSYFGLSGNVNAPVIDGSSIDGISVDFDTRHYTKMNLNFQTITNFDTFNALEINGQPPTDFEFNAILWYYDVVDQNNVSTTNLYGISFLDHPDNNPRNEEVGIRFPPFRKLVTNGLQDGTAYQFALNLNFNIIHENPVEAYNPEALNSLFSMSLYNEAMRRLSTINDSFLEIIAEHSRLREDIDRLRQLLYTQTDFQQIRSRLDNLDRLLRLYSTNQLISSDSIEVVTNPLSEFAGLQLRIIEPSLNSIETYFTSEMFLGNQVVPVNVTVDTNKDILIRVINNDEVEVEIADNNNLKVLIGRDLAYRQSMEFRITGSEFSKTNKKLDIFIRAQSVTQPAFDVTGQPVTAPVDNPLIETILLSDIDLPIFYNNSTSTANSAKNWKSFDFEIDFDKSITVDSNYLTQISLQGNPYIIKNSIKPGDCFVLNNLFVGTSSVYDFSGQYFIDSVGATNSQIIVDMSMNSDFVNFIGDEVPYVLHTATSTLLSNQPYFSLNKGKSIKITRVSALELIPVDEKYHIEVRDYDY
jgi:hypothetical protein